MRDVPTDSRTARRQCEVVCRFEGAGFNHQSILGARHQGIGDGAFDGGSHAADVRAVKEGFDRSGIGIGNHIPDGMRVFVGFEFADQEDFDRSELDLSVEEKSDRSRGDWSRVAPAADSLLDRPMADFECVGLKSAAIEIKAQAGEQNDDCSEKNVFPGHTVRV